MQKPQHTQGLMVPDWSDVQVLAIVGSVQLAGCQEAEELIEGFLRELKPAKVISGGARGIDSMAVACAERLGIPTQEFRPDQQAWLRGSPHGFWARNLRVAEACTHLVRIVATTSKTYGSGWTRDRAKEKGKLTVEYQIKWP